MIKNDAIPSDILAFQLGNSHPGEYRRKSSQDKEKICLVKTTTIVFIIKVY